MSNSGHNGVRLITGACSHIREWFGTPKILAIVYLALIPGFALVFLSLGSGNFSQSSLLFEPKSFDSERRLIAESLGKGVLTALDEDWAQLGHNLVAIEGSMKVRDPVVETGHVRFEFVGALVEGGGSLPNVIQHAYLPEAFRVQVDVDTSALVVKIHPGAFLFLHRMQIADPITFAHEIPDPPTVNLSDRIQPVVSAHIEMKLPKGPPIQDVTSADSLFLHLPMNEQDEFNFQRSYKAMSQNDPLSAGGVLQQVSRMIYLSGVTTTTLGFGDIVPISDTARMLVMVNSVIGVLLAGLFFFAVAKRASFDIR